jgi:DNA-binding beta-propeller fold protein YncE
MLKKSLYLFGSIMLLLSTTLINAQTKNPEYRIAKTIHLQGDGGWDYLSVDEVNSRLFVSHNTQVNVVDLKKGDQIAVIPDTKGVHGIAIANDLNKAFISNGKDSSVTVVDLKTFAFITKISITGKNPDAILYDQFSHKVFTFNGRSSNSNVIDALLNKQIGTIPLSGKPEFAQTDGKGKIYVNIEDKSSISVINATTLKVEAIWSISPGEEPSGLALDNINHRLFSVCSNKLMVVTDAITGKQITTVPIGARCDGVAFDPSTKRIFSSNGEGTITVIQQESADKYKVVETFATQPGARTITVDKTTHHLFVSAGEYEPGEGRRPVKPGTFVVLEIEPVK